MGVSHFGDNTNRNKVTLVARAFVGSENGYQRVSLYDEGTDTWKFFDVTSVGTPYEVSQTMLFTADIINQGNAYIPSRIYAYKLNIDRLGSTPDVYDLVWQRDVSFNSTTTSTNYYIIHGFYRDYLYVFLNVKDNAYIIDCTDGSIIKTLSNFAATNFISTDDYIAFGSSVGNLSSKVTFMTHEGETLYEATYSGGPLQLCEYNGEIYVGLGTGKIIVGEFDGGVFFEKEEIDINTTFDIMAVDDKYYYLFFNSGCHWVDKASLTISTVNFAPHAIPYSYTILSDHRVVVSAMKQTGFEFGYPVYAASFIIYSKDGSYNEVQVAESTIKGGFIAFSDWMDRIYFEYIYEML